MGYRIGRSGSPTHRALVTAAALVVVVMPTPAWALLGDEIPPSAGSRVRAFLLGEPARTTSTAGDELAVGPEIAEARSRFPGMKLSRSLSRAARQCARFVVDEPGGPPYDFVEFALRWAGSADLSPWLATVRTTEDDVAGVLDEVARKRAERRDHADWLGLGRAATSQAPFRWVWVAIMVERRLALDPVPRAVPPGETVTVVFRLGNSLHAPRLLHLDPTGGITRVTPKAADNGFAADLTLGVETGEHRIEILADGRFGPEVVALAPVWVGRDPPSSWVGPARDPAPESITADGVAVRLLELINAERRGHSLAPLHLDSALVEAARRHSQDMATNGFFGHKSPRLGALGERLDAAGIRVLVAAENLSCSESVREAHDAIMGSPAHRANVLSPDFTHVGIGVAAENREGVRSWLITEDFMTPMPMAEPPKR